LDRRLLLAQKYHFLSATTWALARMLPGRSLVIEDFSTAVSIIEFESFYPKKWVSVLLVSRCS